MLAGAAAPVHPGAAIGPAHHVPPPTGPAFSCGGAEWGHLVDDGAAHRLLRPAAALVPVVGDAQPLTWRPTGAACRRPSSELSVMVGVIGVARGRSRPAGAADQLPVLGGLERVTAGAQAVELVEPGPVHVGQARRWWIGTKRWSFTGAVSLRRSSCLREALTLAPDATGLCASGLRL